MRVAALLFVVGCSDPAPTSTDYYQDAYESLDCSKVPANTHVEVASSGLVTGSSATIPLEPTAEHELVVVAIASASTSFYRRASVDEGTETLQIATSSNPCGKWAINTSIGDIGPATTSLRVTAGSPGTFAVFVARFSGLPPHVGAQMKGRYAWSQLTSGVDVEACPGTAIVTTTISCGELALAADSPFTLIDSVQGMAAAAYVPTERGRYGASWATDAESSSMTLAFP